MHKFIADTVKNRLFMQMEGFYSADKMLIAHDAVVEEAKKLKPGFTIINDSADLHIQDLEGVNVLGKMIDSAKDLGAKTVIRLVKDKLSQIQLAEQTKKNNLELEVIEVLNVDEVEQVLAERSL